MKKKKTLSSGEFAKLCKTTKETLFHYDREGLLKPKYISGNGYRRYGMEQFLDFDLISMLKDTGSTLKEIKACRDNMDTGEFLALLETKRLAARKELSRLAQRVVMLRDMAACTREALNSDYDLFTLQYQAEERLETFRHSGGSPQTITEFIESMVEYIDFYEQQNRTPRYPVGAVLGRSSLLQGQYEEECYFSRATRATPRAQLHVKPAGRYAVVAHQGSFQTFLQTFREMLEQIEAAGLRLSGEAYIYDLMSYILLGTAGNYVAKYCIRVE